MPGTAETTNIKAVLVVESSFTLASFFLLIVLNFGDGRYQPSPSLAEKVESDSVLTRRGLIVRFDRRCARADDPSERRRWKESSHGTDWAGKVEGLGTMRGLLSLQMALSLSHCWLLLSCEVRSGSRISRKSRW